MVGSGAKKRGACFDKGRGFGEEGGGVGWNTKTNLRKRGVLGILLLLSPPEKGRLFTYC